jgi:hypothetical protein
MSDLEDVRKRIAEIKEPHGPETPTSMPPKTPTQPIEDEGEQPKPSLPKGSAGY